MVNMLPNDANSGTLVGRIWSKDLGGPTPVAVKDGELVSLAGLAATMSEVLELASTAERIRAHDGDVLGSISDISQPDWRDRDARIRILSPVDLQCVKACGVTFAVSAIERVIEERSAGDPSAAVSLRAQLSDQIGGDIGSVVPGTAQAAELKSLLQEQGLWSQYLEVAIGPDAEVFSKSPVLASVGWGSFIGIRSDSVWNNPEPEIALVCTSRSKAVGATLANDVNSRDIEGRSALLLGKAKDNNASCALGPFIRLFDESFSLDSVRKAEVNLTVEGDDGFRLEGTSNMALISRDPLELIEQTGGKHHSYPDGFALLLGTLFAPIQDRDVPGEGFSHKMNDRVEISSPKLGALVNRVKYCHEIDDWDFGITALMRNLAKRGLL